MLISAGDAHRDDHVDELEVEDALLLLLGDPDDPVLRERGVQVDDVRHHRRADDPDGEEHALGPVEARDEAARDARARRARHEDLQGERADDDADQRRDHGLEPPEPARLQREDRERGSAREQRGGEERDVEEELEADRGADELGDVGRHRDDLRLDPEQDVRPA